jgi:uncharacterized protein YndB with AHSA1/START domain
MSEEKLEPVRKKVLVNASQARAFQVFTQEIDRWWPRQHHVGKSPLKKAMLEAKTNGRWYATHEDGSESDTGKVLLWEPPQRLILAWQLNATWQFDPSFVTEVEVTFTPDGPEKTWVELEHRNIERFGETANTVRNSIDSPGGWTEILDQFAKAAAA